MNAAASMRPRFAAVAHIDTLKRRVYLSYCVFEVAAFDSNLLSIVFTQLKSLVLWCSPAPRF